MECEKTKPGISIVSIVIWVLILSIGILVYGLLHSHRLALLDIIQLVVYSIALGVFLKVWSDMRKIKL